jgi:hypothetical protein
MAKVKRGTIKIDGEKIIAQEVLKKGGGVFFFGVKGDMLKEMANKGDG